MKQFNLGPSENTTVNKGNILLAEPFLDDPYFKRTVILVCEHNEEGSFGFVLNNYIDVELDQIMDGLPDFDTKISIGGPVKNSNLYYIHTLGNEIRESVEIFDGIFMGGDFDQLKDKIAHGLVDQNQVRFFVGYSGWSPQQLEDELRMKSWFVGQASPNVLMNTGDSDLWKTILSTMGSRGKIIANLPDDPSLN
ncbi:MAG: YqgE/AlgH family protein [Flavobacteriales bacterium]|nr:YqgE/AlgH family protein [Flavobacteriales bacterium]